jgi:hypothetical protein
VVEGSGLRFAIGFVGAGAPAVGFAVVVVVDDELLLPPHELRTTSERISPMVVEARSAERVLRRSEFIGGV